MEVSIIIVNYKTPKLLGVCLKSIFKYVESESFEVIVVDNYSQDESKSIVENNYPLVKWVDMGRNGGFGAANNKGIELAKGEFVLLLNSDTEFYEDSLAVCLPYYKSLESKGDKVGLLGCPVKHFDGRLQPSCNYFTAGIREAFEEHPIGIKVLQHWLKIKKLRNIDKYARLNESHEITWLGVPFALIRSSVIKQNNFDERFFMYSEDEELNYRLSKNGYKSFFIADSGIYHHIGASSTVNEVRDTQIFYSKLLFIRLSRGSIYFNIYAAILKSTYKLNFKFTGNEEFLKKVDQVIDAKQKIKYVMASGDALNMYKVKV